MTKTFTGSKGTRFEILQDGTVEITKDSVVWVPLVDLLEFADSIEREQTRPDQQAKQQQYLGPVESVYGLTGRARITPEPSRRTELLAIMAAIIGFEPYQGVDCTDAVNRANQLLAAVEAREAK